MISNNMHRIISEIEKRRDQGQIIHILTGNGINDHYFYNMYYGIKNLSDTLRLYYLVESKEYDYFLHVCNSNQKVKCYQAKDGALTEIEFKDIFEKGKIKSSRFNKNAFERKSDDNQSEEKKQALDDAQKTGDDISARLEGLTDILKKGEKRILLLLENMEWISNLYDQPNTLWIAALQNWTKSKKFLAIVTIKDVELLKRYNFSEKETFIGYPSANEIQYAYIRYIMSNMSDGYKFNFKDLDSLSQSMSIGSKDLLACMRILRKVTNKNKKELIIDDFKNSFELNIEENIPWQEVILDDKVKTKIAAEVDKFMQQDEQNAPLKGLVLTGPPGTGKTMIAKSLATEKKCHFMAPTLADLKGEYVGQSSAKIKRIFAEARANEATILFVDEADTVFPSRSGSSMDRDSFGLDMVNQFLQELDGATTGKQKIFTIAATNRYEAMDSAIKSRLSSKIEIPLPNDKLREEMFNSYFKKYLKNRKMDFSLANKYFKDDVIEKSKNMSGRDITNFIKRLITLADIRRKQLCNDKETADLFITLFKEEENKFVDEVCSKGLFEKDNIVSPENNNETDIIGYEDLKDKIEAQVEYLCADPMEKQQYKAFGVVPPKGVLLYGPPGNGKTKLAKAIAKKHGLYFFKVVSKDVCGVMPAETMRKLSDIFSETIRFSNLMADCKGIVLFFDEFDSLAGVNVLDATVRGAFLTYLANADTGIRNKDSKILFMAATNYYGRIDEAIKRTGRIDTHLLMDNPKEADGIEMLKHFWLSDIKRISNVEFKVDSIKLAYDKLRLELKNNQEVQNQAITQYFEKGINLRQTLTSKEQEDLIEKIIENIRPSGSDIENLYKELKSIAFRKKHFNSDGKLLIDESIVDVRFSKMI